MKIKRFAATLAALITFSPAAAFAEVRGYHCEFIAFGSKAEQSWIPTKALFLVDMNAKTAKAALAFVGEIKQDPWPVTVKGVGSKKMEFSWWFKDAGVKGNGSDLSLDYTVRLNTKNNSVTVRAWPRGYDNDMRGKGTCALTR